MLEKAFEIEKTRGLEKGRVYDECRVRVTTGNVRESAGVQLQLVKGFL